MGVCLLEESTCWGFMHGETAVGNETDVELELKKQLFLCLWLS